ncbi:MAG: hypothetical protein KF868_22160 [Acidobacteria bacterium]|nr:hypothetical protein [Acidobacteriota bacterium]MCW5967595.1 hypothetical protein [Blastocatellales bacterium]
MPDEPTQTLNDDSAEARILARLDALEPRIDERLSALEAHAEDRKRETRPLLEKALADIASVAADVRTINSKLDVFAEDMITVRAKQREADARLHDLEMHLHRN